MKDTNTPPTAEQERKDKEAFLKSAAEDILKHLKSVGFKKAALYDVEVLIWRPESRELRAYVKHPELHYDRELYLNASFTANGRGKWQLKDVLLTVSDRKGEVLIAFARTAKDVEKFL
jgi:hypothetical protein